MYTYIKVMGKGKRYEGKKLNVKKVVAAALVLAVFIMIIILMVNLPKIQSRVESKNVTTSYLSVYTNNKWGVINSKGEFVIEPTYDNMVVVPDPTKTIFICQDNVDFENGTFNSYAIDNNSKRLFTSYDKVEALQNVDNINNVWYESNVLKVQKDGKYGLINFNGKEILATEYTSIEPLKNVTKSFVTVKDGKKGLVDNSGSIIIENKYTDITALTDKYEDGYIVKDENNKFGLINYNKKQVLECKYTEITNVSGSEMYVAKEGQDIELISSDGTVRLKNAFKEAVSIDNSNVTVKENNLYGVIGVDGKTVLPKEYQYLKYAFDGNYIARKDSKYGIINVDGSTKVDFKYSFISYEAKEGFIEADKENNETDLLDTSFVVKTSGVVSEINDKLGYVKVRTDSGYKYFNFKLEEKDVKDVLSANTLFLSKNNDKYGFVDKNGVVVVDYIYDDATEQNEYGFSAVKKDGKWGAIDSAGKVIIQPTYEFTNNLVISFINRWHLAPDLNANYYTDTKE